MAARRTKEKKQPLPIMHVKEGATDQDIIEQRRREFRAADLQGFTEIEEGIPLEKLLADLEAVNKKLRWMGWR